MSIEDSGLTVNQVKNVVLRERKEWLKQYSSESLIKQEVFKKLDNEFNKLIFKTLNVEEALKGFYGPPVSKYIKDSVTVAVQQWASKNFNTIPAISTEEFEEVRDFFKSAFLKSLKQHAEHLASENAKEYIKEILTQTLEKSE